MNDTRANFKNQNAAMRKLETQVGQISKQLAKRPHNTLPGIIKSSFRK